MKRLVVLILLLVIAATPALAGSDGFTLTMVDVGAAECIVVMVDGETMIVDAGYAKSWESIDQAVQYTGTDSISYFVITHPHADHIGSAAKIIENYEVKTVLLPPITYESAAYGRFKEVLVSSGIPVEYPYVGDQYMLGNAQITIGHGTKHAIRHYVRMDIENMRLCPLPAPKPSGIFSEMLSWKEDDRLV